MTFYKHNYIDMSSMQNYKIKTSILSRLNYARDMKPNSVALRTKNSLSLFHNLEPDSFVAIPRGAYMSIKANLLLFVKT